MPIVEAAAVVATLKNAADFVEKVRSGESKDDLRMAGAALAEMLISARLAALDLIEQKAMLIDERTGLHQRIKSLEAEVRRMSEFDEQSGRFERVQPRPGTYVYRERGNENSPYFCPNCIADKKISIMQIWDSEFGQYLCQGCEKSLFLKG